MPEYRRLFEPIQIGKLKIPNRIVNTPHRSRLSERRDLRYLQERARGGAGFIGIHSTHGVVNFSVGPGRWVREYGGDYDAFLPDPSSPEGIEHWDKVGLPGMKRQAEVIHNEGARCYAQTYNLGGGSHYDNLYPSVAPSAIPEPHEAHVPHALTEEEIGRLVLGFAHCIRRAKEADIDAAELHAAHGYLMTEFLSPKYNRRTDRYGGSPENRVRLCVEIIAAARRFVGPDYPIGIRVGLDGDGHSGGLTTEDLVGLGMLLAPHVAWISISGGTHTGLQDGIELPYVSPWYVAPGHNVAVAKTMRQAVKVPVMVAGRIADPATAESVLADGAADMVGIVRALIADPEFPKKAREGREGEIRMCLGLDECHYIGQHRKAIVCAVNAEAGREEEMELRPAVVKKTVLVVGAGPAGMEAARVAALRGHSVYLADRERALGGTARILAQDPNRRNLADLSVYFQRELPKHGVQLLLGEEITAEMVAELGPDALIVATGGTAFRPELPGIESSHVVTALEVCNGRAVGGRVLVVAGHDSNMAAPTMAEFLADRGHQVELISEHVDVAGGVEWATRYILLKRLLNKNVTLSPVTALVAAEPAMAIVRNTFTRKERRIAADNIILACGLRPNDYLARTLKGRVKEIHVVGDALAPRRIVHATLEGARAGRML